MSHMGWGAGGVGVPFVVFLGADVKEMERRVYLWTALDGDDGWFWREAKWRIKILLFPRSLSRHQITAAGSSVP